MRDFLYRLFSFVTGQHMDHDYFGFQSPEFCRFCWQEYDYSRCTGWPRKPKMRKGSK